ncbi:MAG: AAA family ATPase, partial [Saprospiraceae bacterium]
MTPVILLAFANDKQNTGAGYLRGLTAERNAIRDALSKAEENGLCQVLVEPDATIDRIFDLFQNNTYRDRIAIFHYGGHADSYSLLLESASGATATAHSEGLVNFLAKQKSLKLVFLNGCSSQKQSEELIAAGLPAVIGTSQSINDTVATGLASRFYKGMSAGMNVERAWTDAVDQIKTENGAENSKALFVESILGSPGEDQFPWKLYTGEGGTISKAWNLPEAANQPLFGLELPNAYYRKLPAAPYVGLRSFKREEAAIFFGRGNDIRSLYTQLEREQPVILLSGKKGVGKSSLLAAGLTPRLESAYVVSCNDISGKNISDSLSAALDQLREENGLEKLPPKDKSNLQQKIAELQKLISSVSGYAKDVIQNELTQLIRLDGVERLSYYEQWISIEEKTKKPLVIILDEISSDSAGWKTFVEILVSIFETEKAPLGKLVLSIDEEHHASFCDLLQSAHFPYADVFLQPLTWDGMNEAITGISLSPVTKEYYRLQIENTPSNNFPTTLCGDLSDGDYTLVAPYLQVILSDLWTSAVLENAQAPSFTMRSYQQGILSGEIMDRFLNQQLASLKEWKKEPVQSGLALDLLYRHTSALGKSEILEAAKRKLIYGDREEIVNNLIRKCKELFLLTSAHSDGTNLGHNLLALVVIRQYSISLSPGQQAARILSAKTGETAEPGKNSWLNETELDAVEKG